MDSDLGGRITMVSVALTPPRDDVVPFGFADRAPTGRQTHTGFLRNRGHCAVTGELVLVVHVLDAGGKHGLGLPTQTPVTTDGGHHACPRGSKGLAITDLPSRGQTLGCFALGLLAVCALMGLLAYRARNAYYFHRFGLCPLPVSSRGGLSFPASGQLKKSQFSRFGSPVCQAQKLSLSHRQAATQKVRRSIRLCQSLARLQLFDIAAQGGFPTTPDPLTNLEKW